MKSGKIWLNKIISRRALQTILIIFFSCLFLFGCNKSSDELSLGEEYVNNQLNLSKLDTFTVNLSTVLYDSMVTSGTGKILLGCCEDKTFGKIKCSSYFQLGVPSDISISNNEQYDSVYLMITYNGYSFGDTSKSQKIVVNQLTENIKYNEDGNITNKASFNYDQNPIGTLTYSPHPNSSVDTLAIKISNNIGQDLFDKLQSGSEVMSGSDNFISYFHGLKLSVDGDDPNCIIGFNANSSNVRLIVYTTITEDLDKYEFGYQFPLSDTSKQFNNIQHDLTSTQLSNLVRQRTKLPSSQTGGLSFIQGGVGLVTRLEMPYLQEILQLKRGKLVKAELSLAPSIQYYNNYDLPSSLELYESDNLNRKNDVIKVSSFINDELYHEETSYTFDITDYLTNALSNSYFDPSKGFIITLSSDAEDNEFTRLILDSKNKNTKLKIYYMTY